MGALLDCLADEEELVLEAAFAVLVGEFGREARANAHLALQHPADGFRLFQAVHDDLSLEIVEDVVVGVLLHGLKRLRQEILSQDMLNQPRLDHQCILDQLIVIEQLDA